jgi:putative Mg2+ transporter-C (MgtC) family protein
MSDLSFQVLKIVELVLKLCLSVLCGGLMMFDRQQSFSHQTNISLIFTCFSTCLLVIIWQLNFYDALGLSVIFISSIIVAVGVFSSSIIIIRGGSSGSIVVAASIWVAAGIGIAIGYGLYFTAITATLLAFIFLRLIDKNTLFE